MTQTAPPTTDSAQSQQFMLFDLNETIAPLAPAEPPSQRESTPTTSARSAKRSQRPAAKTSTQPTPADPVRLEIAPTPPLPEIPPLLLAGVRAALFQTLAQEALATYQTLRDQHPAASHDQVILAVEPVRLGASAQLLLDSPALNAAVSLLALGATLTPRT